MAKKNNRSAFMEINDCHDQIELDFNRIMDSIASIGTAVGLFHRTFVNLCRSEVFRQEAIRVYRDTMVDWHNKHKRKNQKLDFEYALRTMGVDEPLIKEAVKVLYTKKPKKT